MSLPNLLFVTPVLPSLAGSGTMLRAAASVEALSRRFRVHVLNYNLWSTNFGTLSLVQRVAAAYAEVSSGAGEVDSVAHPDRFFPGIYFSAIHTFRLPMARLTLGMLARMKAPHPYLVLDLDDDDAARSACLVSLLEKDSDLEALKRARAEQAQLRMLERMLAPRFQAICLANPNDCRALAARYPGVSVHHLPNAVCLPDEAPAADRRNTARLLFVGALNYPPNIDGIGFFCERVLPLIEERASMPVSLQVVGSDVTERVALLARNPAVTIHSNVPDVAPYYREADLCIVPLRAGSGTRIKILEAFRFLRPVVSTHLGAEGLAVKDGEHLLLADEPETMAQACLALLGDHERRDRMVCSASMWVRENHSIAAIQTAVDSIYRPILTERPGPSS
jgi:glycosyltransferase involved in cell wall biosynthesis